MKVTIKGTLRHLLTLAMLVPNRGKRAEQAPGRPLSAVPGDEPAQKLHPEKLFLTIAQVREENASTRTFRLVAGPNSPTGELPPFRAGQYLSLKIDVGGVSTTRPYSISSSPREALQQGFYEITLQRKEGGFVSPYLWDHWQVGTEVQSSGPQGFFYYEPLLDTPELVGLAGGTGITAFRSMLKDMADNDMNVRFTLLYGIRRPADMLFEKEFAELVEKRPGQFRVIPVCSEPDGRWSGETGRLSTECIRKLVGDLTGKTLFVAGPPEMYLFIQKELEAFALARKQVRYESFGRVAALPDPALSTREAGRCFQITAHCGEETRAVPAVATETVLVALERAHMVAPSRCRSGECGACRSLLLAGRVYISPQGDGRRAADLAFGYVHPCASYPRSDLEVRVPRSDGVQ